MDENSLIPGANDAPDTSNTGEQPTADELAEDAEWDAALEEFAPGLSETTTATTTTEETTKDEQADTTTTTTTIAEDEENLTTTTTTIDPNETPEQKTERERIEAEAAARASETEEEDAPDASTRTARQTAREAAREVEAVATDIREKMYANVPRVLSDKDGDPITSINDVMNLVNPNTGEGFTDEEAAVWLLSAQQQFNQNLANQDKEITQIAELNLDLKDQADSISYEYGELLKAMPDLRDQVWAEYHKTLVRDPETDIITKAPVSMESFYDMALQPYVKLAESLEAQETARLEAEKAQADAQKLKNRGDRADIYGRTDTEILDDDEKEWDAAHKAYFK